MSISISISFDCVCASPQRPVLSQRGLSVGDGSPGQHADRLPLPAHHPRHQGAGGSADKPLNEGI